MKKLQFDKAAGAGSHECICGAVVPFDLAWVTKHFMTADPSDRENKAHHSLALPPCSKCGSQAHLNMNLPADHPHPDATIIRALVPAGHKARGYQEAEQ